MLNFVEGEVKIMHKILVVVDYQNDFVNGSLGFHGAENLDEKIVSKIREYLSMKDGLVLYTMDTHQKNYLDTREGKQLPIEHCIDGTEGWQLFGKVGELLKDGVNSYMIKKATFGISPTDMNSELFPAEVESVELCGLVTNMCVVSNAVVFQAKYPNAQIVVNANLCDSFSKELHEKTLDVLEGMQVRIIR